MDVQVSMLSPLTLLPPQKNSDSREKQMIPSKRAGECPGNSGWQSFPIRKIEIHTLRPHVKDVFQRETLQSFLPACFVSLSRFCPFSLFSLSLSLSLSLSVCLKGWQSKGEVTNMGLDRGGALACCVRCGYISSHNRCFAPLVIVSLSVSCNSHPHSQILLPETLYPPLSNLPRPGKTFPIQLQSIYLNLHCFTPTQLCWRSYLL